MLFFLFVFFLTWFCAWKLFSGVFTFWGCHMWNALLILVCFEGDEKERKKNTPSIRKKGKTFLFRFFAWYFVAFVGALFSFNFFLLFLLGSGIFFIFICLSSMNWWMLKLDIWTFLPVHRFNPLGFLFFLYYVVLLSSRHFSTVRRSFFSSLLYT